MHRPALSRHARSDAFLSYLEMAGILSAPSRKRAEGAVAAGRERLETVLTELGLMEEQRLLTALSDHLGLSVMPEFEPDAVLADELKLTSSYMIRNGLVPLTLRDGCLTLATCYPLDDDAPRLLAYARGSNLELVLTSQPAVSRAAALLGASSGEGGTTADGDESTAMLLESDAERLRDLASEAPTVRLLNRIIQTAVEREVSDIHIEPLKDHIRVRYRIDGVLQTAERIDKQQQMALISRVKILSRLNIAEQRLPQDGRIRFAVKGREIDFRVSTAPSVDGESVVLRILDRRDVKLDLPALGFSSDAVAQVHRFLEEANGIILVTGPTGSGKTTTLYAAISHLNAPDTKIFTVEDPVEYQLDGITQILVRPQIGLEFASVLRSVLRQDPDIIMVGEIRDPETARIAMQASLTGHLVLSTLHTNSAAASLTRLRDIGLEDYLIAATLRGVISQRLLRKRCPSCAGLPEPAPACSGCGGTGYRGRTVIYEILMISPAIRAAVLANASEDEINRIAVSEGMVEIRNNAAEKIANGETTAAEVARTIGVEDR